MKHTWILAATALVAPSLANAQQPQPQPQPQPQQQQPQQQQQQKQIPAADFVSKVALGNLFEIQSSNIALEKSQDAQVRQYAERMVREHTAANNRLREVAKNQPLPSSLSQAEEEKLRELRNAGQAAFGRNYIDTQREAHRLAVAMFESYAQNGDDQQLKQYAQETLPTLRDHLQSAIQIEQRLQTASAAQSVQGQNQADQDRAQIVIERASPSIRVEQARPQVIVQQPQPNVTVRQPQPDIMVLQPQPTVTVTIPQPEIVVRMPKPEVNVAMAQPQVQVNMPKPEVQVTQPEQPQVQVQPAQPQVQVQQAGQPQVQVQTEGQPQVRFERREPKVIVQQPEGQPRIRFEHTGEAREEKGAEQQQQPPQPAPQQKPAQQQQTATPGMNGGQQQSPQMQPQPQPQPQPQQQQPAQLLQQPAGQNLQARQLMNMTIYGSGGKRVGDVERVMRGPEGKIYAITGVGGFLGIGERRVAIPLENADAQGDRLVLRDMTEEQVRNLPVFQRNGSGYQDVTGTENVRIGSR